MRSGRITAFLLLAGVLAGSCREKEPVQETISVNPETIQASASLDSYDVQVSSNAAWEASVEGGLSWITLTRTTGHENAKVGVRVGENKYKDAREAGIVFKTAGGASARVLVRQEGAAGGEEAPDGRVLRIGTYNLRMSGLDKEAAYVWDVRKERLKQSLQDCNFDIFGLQELSTTTQAWLDQELSSQYEFRYFSPYAQRGVGDRAQGIGWRKDAFTMSDWHYFWASGEPDVMSDNDTGSQGDYKRGGCCCVLTHKASGMKLFFMNNHGCLNAEPNMAFAHVYADQEKRFNPDGLPSFFVGDMNARESSEEGSVYKTYTAWWKDPYMLLDASKKSGASGTYNGYSNTNGKSRIDYVFFRGEGITPVQYRCDNKLYDGLYASDHFPVWVEFAIK
jgi:endonuclease/exonuclease/phosphatase family metal-dependent hydrolase